MTVGAITAVGGVVVPGLTTLLGPVDVTVGEANLCTGLTDVITVGVPVVPGAGLGTEVLGVLGLGVASSGGRVVNVTLALLALMPVGVEGL